MKWCRLVRVLPILSHRSNLGQNRLSELITRWGYRLGITDFGRCWLVGHWFLGVHGSTDKRLAFLVGHWNNPLRHPLWNPKCAKTWTFIQSNIPNIGKANSSSLRVNSAYTCSKRKQWTKVIYLPPGVTQPHPPEFNKILLKPFNLASDKTAA